MFNTNEKKSNLLPAAPLLKPVSEAEEVLVDFAGVDSKHLQEGRSFIDWSDDGEDVEITLCFELDEFPSLPDVHDQFEREFFTEEALRGMASSILVDASRGLKGDEPIPASKIIEEMEAERETDIELLHLMAKVYHDQGVLDPDNEEDEESYNEQAFGIIVSTILLENFEHYFIK